MNLVLDSQAGQKAVEGNHLQKPRTDYWGDDWGKKLNMVSIWASGVLEGGFPGLSSHVGLLCGLCYLQDFECGLT